MEHELIIISLHDCDVKCSCGRWWYSFTGAMSLEKVCDKHQEHIKREHQKIKGGTEK
jgi:hypothetical protein